MTKLTANDSQDKGDPDDNDVNGRNDLTRSPATDEQFMELVHSLLEHKGKFQIILIMLLSLNSIIIGINHTITAFHIYVPKFFCKDDPTINDCSSAHANECPNGYKFNETDDRSVAVEFETVCSRSMLAPLINSLYFVGVMLGSLVCSSLCDIYGRRKLVIICLYGQALMALCQYYSINLTYFIAYRLLQGFFIQGLQTCSYTLAMEYCPSQYRTIAATYWESNWAIGLGVLGVVAYYIREWRLLTLTLATPALISILYIWFIPESIVWLETKGRRKEAIDLIYKISKFNKRYDIMDQCNSKNLEPLKTILDAQDVAQANTPDIDDNADTITAQEPDQTIVISVLIKNDILRKHLLSMICIWFSVTLSYYGILYYLPNLVGSRHLNFEIGALIELCAYILAYFILSGLGRRIPMAFYQYSNGFLILVLAVLTTLPEGSYNKGVTVVITLLAKGLAVSSFCAMFIYCSELLPTVCRGLGLGLCGCAARCGSLLAPQIMAMIGVVPQFVPLAIMSVLLLITATVTLILPETLSTILPNTIAEAGNIWGKKSDNSIY